MELSKSLICLFLTLFLAYILIINTDFWQGSLNSTNSIDSTDTTDPIDSTNSIDSTDPTNTIDSTNSTNTIDSTEYDQICVLPNLHPWDTSLRKYLKPSYNPNADCVPKFERRTYIDSNGILHLNNTKEANEVCLYRCCYGLSDFAMKCGDWIRIDIVNGVKPECDVIEVGCNVDEKSTYKFLHAQIFEKPLKDGPPWRKAEFQKNAYDVHIIGIDAVSASHSHRALSQTLHYLQSQLDAIAFPYLNKVGQNSRPNAYAFLMGIQPEQMSKNAHGIPNKEDALCKKALDNDTIFTDFQKSGYRTIEDWSTGVFNWPNCRGFTTNQLDNWIKAFALRYWKLKENQNKGSTVNMFRKSCIEYYEYVIDLIGKYMGSYKGQPKFSFSWMNTIAHDYASNLFHMDSDFRDFFESNKEKFSKSFVFFTSDHGSHVDSIANSPIGLIEKKNPFLIVIIPEELRKNADLMNQLNINSKQLITHYDLYATYLEIATKSHEWNKDTKFSTFDFKPTDRKLIGSSLLHPLKQPRNCKSLKIPFHYCLCEEDSKSIHNENITMEIAELVVKRMNEAVLDSEFHDKCVQLRVNETETIKLTLKEFSPRDGKQLYRSELRVSPSGGYYEALAEVENGNLSLVSQKFPRLDRYSEQTKCIPEHFIRNYCYCKDLLPQ